MEEEKGHDYQWDLIVIGAGSGGISCAKKAAGYGKKVMICDFVKPSPQGTTWGIGGTCVNVGCIPKKLMHYTSLVGEARADMVEAGWELEVHSAHNWERMVTNVNDHIRGLNWGYKKALIGAGVRVQMKLASFIDEHTVELKDKKGKAEQATAERIVVAVGGRPLFPDVPGAKEYCISSDDLFWQPKAPGKSLVIGAGYIAMECGGFIKGMGHEVAVMVRSTPFRTFDQDMAKKIVDQMEESGVRFLNSCSPKSFEKLDSGLIKATWNHTNEEGVTTEHTEEFQTVLIAIGRYPDTELLNFPESVKLNRGRVVVDDFYQTTCSSIYAIGDVIVGSPELTPVAIREGNILADHVYGGFNRKLNYNLIATTIFTPLEYSCIGYSEEKAREMYSNLLTALDLEMKMLRYIIQASSLWNGISSNHTLTILATLSLLLTSPKTKRSLDFIIAGQTLER